MNKKLNDKLDAPQGVATSAPLPNCLTCDNMSDAFYYPFCNLYEMEIDTSNPECIKQAELIQQSYEKIYLHHYNNKK